MTVWGSAGMTAWGSAGMTAWESASAGGPPVAHTDLQDKAGNYKKERINSKMLPCPPPEPRILL
eukprot:1150504-Pelagomonas_calceolata.AAC.2